MIYPLASSTWGKEEVEAIQRVIDTDMYTMGKHVKQFEEAFLELNFLKVRHYPTLSLK